MEIFPTIENAHWLHFVLTPKTTFIETTIEQLSQEKTLSRQQGSSIFVLNEKLSSHAHYFHQCKSWTKSRGCNCWFIKKCRDLGFKTKCQNIGQFTEEHWNNLLSFLQENENQTLSSFHDHESKLEELKSAYDSITPLKKNNFFRCECNGEKKQNSNSNETSRKKHKQIDSLDTMAERIYRLYKLNYWNSTEQAFRDTIFIEAFKTDYYSRTETLKRINQLVYDQLQLEWKDKLFEEIIIIRQNDEFNDCLYYDNDYSANLLCRLLYCQFKSFEKVAEFLNHLLNIMNKTYPKINTLNICGPPGSGKTYFVETIGKLCWFTGRCDSSINKFTQFPFEHMLGKRLTIFNEFNLSSSFKDVVKEILEGSNITINVKYRPRCILERTPIIITTNNQWEKDHQLIDQQAFNQRMISYEWTAQPWLKLEDAYPHPPSIAKLFHKTSDELKMIYEEVPEKEYLNKNEHQNYIDRETYLKKTGQL